MNQNELRVGLPTISDGAAIKSITARINLFDEDEKACVDELWDEYLAQVDGPDPYYFLVARDGKKVAGFAIFGHRALTQGTYDLYWIAVDPGEHRCGCGRTLLASVEEAVRKLGGNLLFVETSGREEYAPTRRFYEGTGYETAGVVRDFYALGDDLVIFIKHL